MYFKFFKFNKIDIDYKDLTVIVKGLVVGKKNDNYLDRYTYRSIESIRKFLPGSKIILSTWQSDHIDEDLDIDELILNKDPERVEMISDDGEIKFVTVNNQIITSYAGLDKVNTKYSLIIRSDMVLIGNGFLKYFLKYNKSKCEGFFKKKIVVLPTYSPRRINKFLFDVCDWTYFGLTEDLKNMFSIPLMDKDKLKGEKVNGYNLISKNLGAEQYVWVNFLKKYSDVELPTSIYFSKELNKHSEESYAKNTIMISASRLGVKCLKMPYAGYGAIPCLSQGLYTMSECNKIYNMYNKDKILYIKNYFEEIIYFIQIKFRHLLKSKNSKVYKYFVNFIRRFNGSKNLLK